MPGSENILCVRISGSERSVRGLISRYKLNLEGTSWDGKVVTGFVFIPSDKAKKLKAPSTEIKVLYNASQLGRERQKEVGKGNRFKDGSIPKGLGKTIKEDGGVVL